jgi:hypothetical protein
VALEKLLDPAEAQLLRISEESKQLTNELVELRLKHCTSEDEASALELQIEHLDMLIERSVADRAFLEKNGTLPMPKPVATS